MTHEIFSLSLLVFCTFRKEEVPDATEEKCHAKKKRILDSLTNFDYLNDVDVDAIRQFREQII